MRNGAKEYFWGAASAGEGAPVWNPGGIGGAYAYCSSYSARGLADVSFGGWVYYPLAGATDGPMMGWASTGGWGGFSIGVWGNKFYYRTGSSGTVNMGAVTIGSWLHVFLVKSGTQFRAYLNGALVGTGSGPASFGSNVATRFKVARGTYADNDSQEYTPSVALAGVCAFQRALSEQEVLSIFSGKMLVDPASAPFSDRLWFGYNFVGWDPGSGTDVPNAVEGGPALTVEGAQYVSGTIPFSQ